MEKQARPDRITEVEPLRRNTKRFLAINPNYFGNLTDSELGPVTTVVGDTSYEELTCLGFDPQHDLLEAVISVKRSFGYDGDLCSHGSAEYVRFFLDYGGGWIDQGLVAVNVHDLPDANDCAGDPEKPLSYVATLGIDPQRRRCAAPVLPKVRAILSWEVQPPSANPNWNPIWGNVLDGAIQIRPRSLGVIDYLELYGKVKISELELPLLEQEAFKKPIPIPDPPPIELAELAKLYASDGDHSVETHRFAFPEVYKLTAAAPFEQLAVASQIESWKSIGVNIGDVLAALENTKADVSYEEIGCVGLDTNLERLTANLRIKRPTGYSGDACTSGSTEYVAFWADWDGECEWSYLGTVALTVHDFRTIPPEGLDYAAVLPVDLTMRKQPCEEPKVVRVRAVLSWAVAPSTSDPDALTTWGNRLDAHVQLPPGPAISMPTAVIGFLGGISISQIDTGTGLTEPGARFAFNHILVDGLGRGCPFGARVVLQGPSFPGYKYKVQTRRVGDLAWSTVTTTLELWDWTGTIPSTVAADSSGLFSFIPFTRNADNILAWWDTAGDDLAEIQLQLYDAAANPLGLPASHLIQLDNTGPEAAIEITSGAGNCGKYSVGDIISGTFVARDAYLGSYSLGTSPNPGPVTPGAGYLSTPPAPGSNWSLDSSNMEPCGYVVTVSVVDRAIVNSASVGHWNSKSRGFCLD